MKKNIAVFVPVRLKSKRLKNKAIKKIGNKTSIEWCVKSCSVFNKINNVIVLTSYLKSDEEIAKMKFNKKVKIFRGHPNNLILRFLNAAEKYKIDTIIRVTGDCPFVSYEVMNLLLKSHIKTKADFTAARKYSVGTSGEIIETSALKKLYNKIKNFKYSEYMTMFFLDNPNYFKLNIVNLPKRLIQNFRLTLDYNEDLIMFNKLYQKLLNENKKFNIVNIFKVLKKDKSIVKINNKKKLVYTSEKFRNEILKYTQIN